MADTKVLVMTAVAENGRDLQIVIAARIGELGAVSPIITLEGQAEYRAGNPYCVYGDAVAEFVGCDKFDTSINVFDCRSGDLEGWE